MDHGCLQGGADGEDLGVSTVKVTFGLVTGNRGSSLCRKVRSYRAD